MITNQEAYQGYLAAVRAGERRRAFEEVEHARAAGLDLRTLYLEVFQPTLREIGQLWQENRLTVAEEHLATAITQSAMLRLYSDHGLPESNGPTLIAACAETERHEIGLRMLCDFLDLEGWETVFLGSSVPTAGLAQMVQNRQPEVVALSASITPHLPQLRTAIAAVRDAAGPQPPLVLVGGRPFLEDARLVQAVGADLSARDAAEAAALLRDRFS
ncbi:MAG TPA: cobalamin-dependent protein [Longimicrobiaceae bacterium]|nr:cobalamin-dependent protein [Longimicrobiaceae bacterium]